MSARILVVDDIAANVKVLEVKLMAEYFDVLTAFDGPTALEIAETQSPDLILTDVMMPGMDGYEVCDRIKSNPETSHIPVVMVTALSDVAERVRGLEAGADDFLTKPVNDISLLARVRSLTRLKLLTDELRVRQASAQSEGMEGAAIDMSEDTSGAKILLAETSTVNAGKITGYLETDGHSVVAEQTIAATLERSRQEIFDILIVSLHLGQEDGLRLCSQLRSNEETRHTPILLTLEDDDLTQLAKGLDLGVTDYLIKPIDQNELRARCRTQVRRRRFHEKLRTMLDTSVTLAYKDPLTSVYNRRYMDAHLDRKIMEIAETGKPVSVLILDLDHFKLVNDDYDHDAGDDVLREFAKRIGKGLRDSDMVARYGGEEFVVVMPDTEIDVARTVAERLREAVCNETFKLTGWDKDLTVTMSVGAACTGDPQETSKALLIRADGALYKAKETGRNRVVCADVVPAEGVAAE